MLNVIIKDVTFEQNYYLRLSEEQYRLLEWLGEKEMLPDIKIEVFEEYKFEEIWKESKRWLQRKKHQKKLKRKE